ncbi:DUF3991 and TOPRIM domain-containing protein [Lactobacillus johnsonii]|uniref:DUF3991 domain-containing protein n=1 Tax=Lactobacillus johnsonii TaxID=33959 RepID=A0A9X0J595_LACJH|nr:DUF3991 and TOPRIM domain-containing protein [Lactobacillus johnsonii]KXN75220.1 hypothetical protein AYJ53_02735 [Lactobacillus johnsonii]
MQQEKENKQHYTHDQVKAANNANLLDFIQDSGVQLRRVGHDSYKGVEHDSLVITPSKNSFYWNSMSTGGVGALDFATKYLLADSNLEEGEKFQKGMELVLKSSAGQFIPHKEDLQPFAFNKNQLSKQFNQAYAYLTKTRKINPKLIKQLHEAGLIEQNQYGNALFLWRDPTTRKIKGASIQGTKINHEKYGKRGTLKKIEPNSTKGFGFSFSVGKPENLYFFEAPIDAMSYYCLHPKLHNSQFIAMDGLKKTVFANYFKLADNQLSQIQSGVKTINFGVDNDAAGTQFMETFQEDDGTYKHLVNSQGEMVPINRVSPSSTEGKDWNEVLQRKSKLSYHSKTLSFKKKQFELTPAYATNHAVTQMEHLLDDYNLTSQNSKVYVSNNKINTIYSNPHAPEILGLIQLDTQDLLNATTIIAKDRTNQYKAINKHIDQQELLDKTINYVVAKNLTTGLYKPKIGATRANLSMNQKEVREQVINSRSYFMKKAKEVEQFEQSPVFSKIHHILKKQDKLLNRSTSSLNIKNEENRYLLTGCLKKGNAKKSFAININPTVLAENDDKISQLFNQKLSNHKSIKNSFKRSYINQQNIVNREM